MGPDGANPGEGRGRESRANGTRDSDDEKGEASGVEAPTELAPDLSPNRELEEFPRAERSTGESANLTLGVGAGSGTRGDRSAGDRTRVLGLSREASCPGDCREGTGEDSRGLEAARGEGSRDPATAGDRARDPGDPAATLAEAGRPTAGLATPGSRGRRSGIMGDSPPTR